MLRILTVVLIITGCQSQSNKGERDGGKQSEKKKANQESSESVAKKNDCKDCLPTLAPSGSRRVYIHQDISKDYIDYKNEPHNASDEDRANVSQSLIREVRKLNLKDSANPIYDHVELLVESPKNANLTLFFRHVEYDAHDHLDNCHLKISIEVVDRNNEIRSIASGRDSGFDKKEGFCFDSYQFAGKEGYGATVKKAAFQAFSKINPTF